MWSSSRGVRAKFVLAIIVVGAVLGAVLVVACDALLDFEAFTIVPADSGPVADTGGDSAPILDAGDGGCIDPTGFEGRGCWRCTPTTNAELLSACTASKFETFDNAARIKGFDASDPRPALDDGRPNPPKFNPGPSSGTTLNDASCPFDDVTKPNPVLVMGATGFPLETIAKAMGNEATIYFSEQSSCLGVGGAVQNNPKMSGLSSSATFGYITYYDKNDSPVVPHSCRIFPGDDMVPDIDLSGLFPDSCGGASLDSGDKLPATPVLSSGWEDFFGLVNPVMFAVPATSTQRVISAEAAYRVYGFGSGTSPLAKGVEPWTNENVIFRRTQTSGTQQGVARSLLMPIDSLRGVDATGSTAMRKAFQTSPDPPRTIGISTSEIVDVDRDSMKSLAYQHYGQPVGFYPDSEANLADRRNVRDGHYFLWIPLHIFVKTVQGDPIAAPNPTLEALPGNSKVKRDAAVKKLVNVMANRTEPPVKTIDIFGAIKRLGDVPECAMTVARSKEGADLVPYKPSASCGCAFEAAAPASAGGDCKPCSKPEDCAGTGKTCSFGFCE